MRKMIAVLLLAVLPAYAGRTFGGSDCIATSATVDGPPKVTQSVFVKQTAYGVLTSRWLGDGTHVDYLWAAEPGDTQVQINGNWNPCSMSNPSGAWYNTEFDYNDTGISLRHVLYLLNGVTICDITYSSGFVSNGYTMYIGSDHSCGHRLTGNMAEVANWNVSATSGSSGLSAAEYDALARRVPPVLVRGGPNLIGYWPLHGIGSPEPDMSGVNHYNGTLTGTTGSIGVASTSWTASPQQLNAY